MACPIRKRRYVALSRVTLDQRDSQAISLPQVPDLNKMDAPTMFPHGDDDQIMRIDDTVKRVKDGTLKADACAPPDMCDRMGMSAKL
ncbi:hypothetical protein [Paraburkholderia phenazinium]|uniref:hypothetical protein n=1 Tax=Paraburkholderia phenazinium TaxID=60549 RepID=UPI00158EBA99|nr:hypothetical protein [Paraburkholderia phenazinium]